MNQNSFIKHNDKLNVKRKLDMQEYIRQLPCCLLVKTQDGKIMHAENIHIFNLKTICIIWRFLNTFLKNFKVNTGVLLSANVVLFYQQKNT